MNTVQIIAIAVGISVAAIFVVSEVIWYYATQEFEQAREEFKESLEKSFEEQNELISEQKESTPEPFEEIPIKETSKSESTENCSGTARCITGMVSKVTDGDTINVDNIPIRFALASAPELHEVNGSEARNFIAEICPVGSFATVDEDDGQTQGSHGRVLGVIYCNGMNLNSELLDSGLGYLSSGFCDSSEFNNSEWAIKHGCSSLEISISVPQFQISNCDSSYPDFCIPSPPPDLDCGDIPEKRFTVLEPDPHRFDGDKDGIGCES